MSPGAIKYGVIDAYGSPSYLATLWSVAAVGIPLLAAWLAWGSADFAGQFLEWIDAISRTVLPVFFGYSVAAYIARTVQRNGWQEIAVLLLVLLWIAISFGLMLVEDRLPKTAGTAAKLEAINSFLVQFKRSK